MARRRQEKDSYSIMFLLIRILVRIAFYVLMVFLAMFLAREAFRFGYAVFHSNPMSGAPGKDIAITITEGMSSRNIGDLLEKKGLIRDSRVYQVQARLYKYRVYPGTYVLNTSQTIAEMVGVMSVPPETSGGSADSGGSARGS